MELSCKEELGEGGIAKALDDMTGRELLNHLAWILKTRDFQEGSTKDERQGMALALSCIIFECQTRKKEFKLLNAKEVVDRKRKQVYEFPEPPKLVRSAAGRIWAMRSPRPRPKDGLATLLMREDDDDDEEEVEVVPKPGDDAKVALAKQKIRMLCEEPKKGLFGLKRPPLLERQFGGFL
jgi:hypothetical protein